VPDLRRLMRRNTFLFAVALLAVLLTVNVIAQPSFANPDGWQETLAAFAPFAIIAMASTPAVVSGNGGIDVSIGPLMTLINVVFVAQLAPHGLSDAVVAIPLLLALGAAIGATTGVLVSVLRFQPVIASLCMLFILAGVSLKIAPSTVSAEPNWTTHLAGSIGPFPGALFTIAAPLLVWGLLKRTAFHRTLFAVGADDVTAYSAGVSVAAMRVAAYALGGLFAAVAGLALTGVVQSADATTGLSYTLVALAAVAIGGTPLTGGRGGLVGSLAGAACIYLMQNVLAALDVSVNWLQVVYGGMLLIGIVVAATASARPRGGLA
jgi:ribose transport system permease protein